MRLSTKGRYAVMAMADLAGNATDAQAPGNLRPVALADIAAHNLLVRERGSGTRAAIERRYEEEGVALAIGSELSSNEAIKQMTAAGLGVAFLSVHACTLEVRNRLLAVLPVPGVVVQGEWHVMHKAARAIPTVAASFHEFNSSASFNAHAQP